MELINKAIEVARKELGTKESPSGSNKVKYNTEYYGRAVMGTAYPWCVVYIWWVFLKAGLSKYFYGGKKTASCGELLNYYKAKNQVVKEPKPGCFALYHWGTYSAPQHIGLITKVNPDGSFYSIEGNTAVGNDSNGGEVMERQRYKSQVYAFVDPFMAAPAAEKKVTVTVPEIKTGSTGKSVEALQTLLNGYGYNCGTVDGEFGAKTDKALRSYQKDAKLVADGICGAKTWNALLNA